jgi:hypothetical protein
MSIENISADEQTLFSSPNPVSDNDLKVIQKKKAAIAKGVDAPIDHFKYYISVADLEGNIHEDEFKQFAGYKSWQEFYADPKRKYKININAKEKAALTNALNTEWQSECTGEDPCRKYTGYLPGVSYPLKEVYNYTNNAKLKTKLTKLLSFKKLLQLKLQVYQMGNPLY